MSTRRPVSALSIAREDHAEAFDVVGAARLGLGAALDGADEILDHAKMPADAVALVERRHDDWLYAIEQAFADRPCDLGPQLVETVPDQAAALADDAPARLPAACGTHRRTSCRDR